MRDYVAHYRLVRLLGEGGMGVVYEARDERLDRSVAVKMIREEALDRRSRERFLREARLAARLTHPNVCQLFDLGEDDGTLYFAMELLDGESLAARIARGPVAPLEAAQTVIAILAALSALHRQGVIHRDCKPSNVFLTPVGVKLLDFGLARGLEPRDEGETIQQLTTVGMTVGTVGYMPPEQLRGQDLDARADLFAVGAILYECLSGRSAFPGSSAVERIAAVLSDQRPTLPDDVPPGLASLIGRGLAKAPDARPPSATAFLRELRDVSEYGDTGVVGTGPMTLAIADFDNLSPDPADNWIGSGMAESLGADLSRVSGLQVLARERWLKGWSGREGANDALDVAQALGMRWLLTGGFQRLGPMLRLTARLTDVASSQVVWAEKADGAAEQIFSMQDRLSASVASALNLDRPTPQPVRPQLSAFECYARGRRLFERLDKASIEQADQLYQQAIAIDPACAPAYAGLSGMYAMRYTFTTDPSVLHSAIDFATRAIETDPRLGDPHVWRGYAYWRLGRHEEGLAEERLAMSLDAALPKAPYFAGAILLDMGRADEALPLEQRAVQVADTFTYSWLLLGLVHLRLDQLDEALYCFERAVRLESSGEGLTVGAEAAAAEALRRRGDMAAARPRALYALERIESADHMYRDTHRGLSLIVLGRCALNEGDRGAAVAAFGQATAHLQGRPRALGGGHLLVQALAGLAIASRSRERLAEAIALFQSRATHNFCWAFFASDIETRVQLAIAASERRHEQADALVADALTGASPRERALIEGSLP